MNREDAIYHHHPCRIAGTRYLSALDYPHHFYSMVFRMILIPRTPPPLKLARATGSQKPRVSKRKRTMFIHRSRQLIQGSPESWSKQESTSPLVTHLYHIRLPKRSLSAPRQPVVVGVDAFGRVWALSSFFYELLAPVSNLHTNSCRSIH